MGAVQRSTRHTKLDEARALWRETVNDSRYDPRVEQCLCAAIDALEYARCLDEMSGGGSSEAWALRSRASRHLAKAKKLYASTSNDEA